MADINLPADLEITQLPILPWFPGQITHQGPFSPKRDYYFPNPGAWRGSLTIAVQYEDSAIAAQVNSIIADMEGGARTLAVPMESVGTTIEAPATTTLIDSIDADGVITLDQNSAIPDGAWIRFADRIYVARGAQPAMNQVVVRPKFAAVVGDELHEADFITVRLDGDMSLPPHTPEFWGPWVIPWVEAI